MYYFTTKGQHKHFYVPRPDPCGHDTIHIQLPLINDMISSKIKQLQARDRPKFKEKLVEYDSEVGRACSTIKKYSYQDGCEAV
jgi:hypothetical protein